MTAPPASPKTADLEVDCGSADVARIVVEAIRPEAEGGPGSVKTTFRLDGGRLHIHLVAPDEVELKATRFSLLRLAEVARRVAVIARKG